MCLDLKKNSKHVKLCRKPLLLLLLLLVLLLLHLLLVLLLLLHVPLLHVL